MLILIFLLIIGSLIVYVSQYNFESVSLNLGFYFFSDIPLFYVIVGSLLTGLVLGYAIHLVHAISSAMALRGKTKELNKNKDEVAELTKRVHQLEIENEKLKKKFNAEPGDSFAL